MPDLKKFEKTLSDTKTFPIKPNNEDSSVSEIEKYLIEAADKNFSQEKPEEEHDDDLGYCTNSNNTSLEHQQDFEIDPINDRYSESSIEDINYAKFLEGINSKPGNHQKAGRDISSEVEKDYTDSIKDSDASDLEENYDSWDDYLHFSYKNKDNKADKTQVRHNLGDLKHSDNSSQQALMNRTTGLVDGSEYSPKTLDDLRFLKEVQNFPLSPKDDQCTLKNKEDEYNTESEKTAISCAESVPQTDETYSDSTYWNSEEDSSCSSDYLLPEDSFLMKLEIPLTESEKSLIDEFYQKMAEVEAQNDQKRKENIHNQSANCTESALTLIKDTTNEYFKKGIRLNASCNGNTVTNLIFEKIKGVLDDVVAVRPSTHRVGEGCDLTKNYEEEEILTGRNLKIMESIIKDLLIKGGKVKRSFFYYDRLAHVTYDIDYDLFEKCRKIDSKLKNVAYESIINSNKQKSDFKVEIDNGYFFIKYEKGNVVELTKVTNNKIIDDLNSEYKLNLKIGILQIGKSIVRVEKLGERRNYTDVPQGIIKMSFTTEVEGKVEKISILLYPNEDDNRKIQVELDEENQEKFSKLKDKSSLGKNCLLGGKNVLQAIQDKEFTKYESYKPATLPTLLEQCSISNVFSSLKDKYTQFPKYLFSG